MKSWDSLPCLPLFLVLHILRILTVTDGAEKYRLSPGKANDAGTSDTWRDTGAEMTSQPLDVTQAVTPPRDNTSTDSAQRFVVKPGGTALPRRPDRHFFGPAVVTPFSRHSVPSSMRGDLQRATPYAAGDGSFSPPGWSEEGEALCKGVAGATTQATTSRLSSSCSRRYDACDKPKAGAFLSRIPVMSPRSRMLPLKPGCPRPSSSRATTGSLDTTRGSASCSLNRPKSKPVQSRLSSTGASNLCPPPKTPSGAERLPKTFTASPWPGREKKRPLTHQGGRAYGVVNSKNLNRSCSVSEGVDNPNVGTHTQSHRRAEASSYAKKSAEIHVGGALRLSSGRRSSEYSELLFDPDTSFSTAPTRGAYRRTRLEDAGGSSVPQPPSPQTLVRFQHGTASPVLDESRFLLEQSIKRRHKPLFEIVLPELVEIAENLGEASVDSDIEENLMAQTVFEILTREEILKISPMSEKWTSPPGFGPFQVVPERLLGAGGASLVYRMRAKGERGGAWAVKIHYCWADSRSDEKLFKHVCSSTRERVLEVYRLLTRDYTSSDIFAKFRFLVPYALGEFVGFGHVIVSHSSDPQRHLLNLVSVMPLMPGSFDTILSVKELSSAAKRATCLSFVELVARLHLQKLIHGDLKPANFFMGLDGEVYLGDFDTVGRQNSKRQCGSMATLDFLDPQDARCHIHTPDKRVPLTPSRDSWSLGLCLFLVWCGAYPFEILNRKSEIDVFEFSSHLAALTPDPDRGDRTTPKLDYHNCPEGAVTDGLVLELIQRFLELDRERRWTPVEAYKLILSAGDFAGEAIRPLFF